MFILKDSRCPIRTSSNDIFSLELYYALDLLSHTSIIFFKVNGTWIFKSRIEDIRVYLRYLCPLLTLSCKCYIFYLQKHLLR